MNYIDRIWREIKEVLYPFLAKLETNCNRNIQEYPFAIRFHLILGESDTV